MQRIKKCLLLFMAVLLVALSFPIFARAEGDPRITVANVSAKPGDTVTVDVIISDNPGICGFDLGFSYDSKKVKLTGVKAPKELGGQFVYGSKAVWLNSEDTTYNGKLLELTVEVLKNAREGDTEIAVTFGSADICNYNEQEVGFRSVPGKLTISKDAQPTATVTEQPGAETSETYKPISESGELFLDDSNSIRISGNDRIKTAIAISRAGWKSAANIVIANAYNYPDALAGATISKRFDAPILLTDSKALDEAVLAEIMRLNPQNVIILGGTAAVSEDIESMLKTLGVRIKRLSGDNRNGTAAAIAEAMHSRKTDAYLVNNSNFADALSISSIAAIDGCPILYINPDGSLPDETRSVLESTGITKAYIIGGTAAINSAAEENLSAMNIAAERIFGEDRYKTSLATCKRFSDKLDPDGIAIATGKNFPDALAGAAYAAKRNMPVVLVGDTADMELKEYISSKGITTLYAFGGTGAVSSDVVSSLNESLAPPKTSGQEDGKHSFWDWLKSCASCASDGE